MANNYSQASADQSVPCSKTEYDALLKALNKESEEGSSGFSLDYYPSKEKEGRGECYLFAEEYASPDAFSEEFLTLVGSLIKQNNMPYLRVGCSESCDKMRPGEFGGYDFKIGQDGSLVFPKIVWPEGYED